MNLHKETNILRHEIKAALDLIPGESTFRDSVRRPLTAPKRALCPDGDVGWALLPLFVCESICGYCEHVAPAAAALEFFKVAADVFDDIEDRDSVESLASVYGQAQATNVASGLLVLGQKAVTRLREKKVEPHVIVSVSDELASSFIKACVGQSYDLSSETQAPSEKRYLDMVALKSASQLECACRIGALVATTDEYLVDCFGSFGHNLGMAAQITNDIQGVLDATGGRNDICQRKKTLPVVYALMQADSHSRVALESLYNGDALITPDMVKEAQSILLGVGAIHYAVLLAEVFRQHALSDLRKVQAAGANVRRLEAMINWQ